MIDDEPITEKVQETSNDDKTKTNFSEPESMPDDGVNRQRSYYTFLKSSPKLLNFHFVHLGPSQDLQTSLTPIPFSSMQIVQELWAKEIWKRQYNKLTSSVPVNKEVVITITSLSAKVRDLGDYSIGKFCPKAVENSVTLLPKLINDLLVSKLAEALTSSMEYVNDKFKELNKVESQRFAILEKALKSTIKSSVKSQLDKVVDLFKCSFGHHLQLLGYLEKILKSSIQIKTG
ncbi:hypothetical protein Tco_0049357 [Tanacetum coccineum]